LTYLFESLENAFRETESTTWFWTFWGVLGLRNVAVSAAANATDAAARMSADDQFQ
jgi:hypothetical protein